MAVVSEQVRVQAEQTEPVASVASVAPVGAVGAVAPVEQKASFRPVVVDVLAPLVAYYTAHSVLGLGLVPSLAIGSAIPAVRTVAGLLRDRRVNTLALVMLVVNLAGIALSTVTGDPRLVIAKDSMVSSLIGGSMIVSVLAGKPMMTAGMRPFIVKGDAARAAAWERLAAGSAAFRRYERSFTLTWGIVLVAECAAKIVGAYTVPVETMVWLGTVILAGAIVLAMAIGNLFAARINELVVAELA